jgi:peptidoglycan/LPS O-acetylase OafA/YrhL
MPAPPPGGAGAAPRRPRAGIHIAALDGIRGLAILGVLLTHYSEPLSAAVKQAWGEGWIVGHIFDAGWTGVDLFFVLSGFLITGILFDAKGKANYFRNFYARRTLRVFPLYYAVLLVALVILPMFHPGAITPTESAKQPWLWFYGTSLYPLFHHGDVQNEFRLYNAFSLHFGHFWSLAVEEHFYLVWPLLVFLCNRQWLMRLCVALACVSLASRCAFIAHGWRHDEIYEVTFHRMDGLVAGAWMALAARGPLGITPVVRWAWWGLAASGGALLLVIGVDEGLGRGDVIVQTLGFSSLAVFFASALLVAVAFPEQWIVRRLLSGRVLTAFGKYSYGLYVYHGLLLAVFHNKLMPIAAKLAPAGVKNFGTAINYMILASAASFAIAFASYHLFEKHLLKLKRFFESRPKAVGSQATAV